MNISLRRAVENEAEAVAELGRATFLEKWKDGYSAEDMDNYLREAFAVEFIRRELIDPSITYLLAEVDGKLAGYGKLVRGKFHAVLGNEPVIELERLYFFSDYHATGLAQQVMNHLLEIAREENWKLIVLGVDINNHRAINFYTKYGFETFDKKIFRVGKVEDTDQLMKLSLR